MVAKLNPDEVQQRVSSKFGDNITILDYAGTLEDSRFLCNVCGRDFMRNFYGLMDSPWGCKHCGRSHRRKPKRSTAHFAFLVKETHGDKYVVVGRYTGTTKPIRVWCRKCQKEFFPLPFHLIHKTCPSKCPNCTSKRLTIEAVRKQSAILHGDGRYTILDQVYVNAKSPLSIQCNKCGRTFHMSQNVHIAGGSGCRFCKESKGEKRIAAWLEARGIRYEREKKFKTCRHRKPLRYDFYLPDLNLLIEFDGKQHFEPRFGTEILAQTKFTDAIKTKWAEENGIQLLRVRYDIDVEKFLQMFVF